MKELTNLNSVINNLSATHCPTSNFCLSTSFVEAQLMTPQKRDKMKDVERRINEYEQNLNCNNDTPLEEIKLMSYESKGLSPSTILEGTLLNAMAKIAYHQYTTKTKIARIKIITTPRDLFSIIRPNSKYGGKDSKEILKALKSLDDRYFIIDNPNKPNEIVWRKPITLKEFRINRATQEVIALEIELDEIFSFAGQKVVPISGNFFKELSGKPLMYLDLCLYLAWRVAKINSSNGSDTFSVSEDKLKGLIAKKSQYYKNPSRYKTAITEAIDIAKKMGLIESYEYRPAKTGKGFVWVFTINRGYPRTLKQNE